jgi:hypothetical protein
MCDRYTSINNWKLLELMFMYPLNPNPTNAMQETTTPAIPLVAMVTINPTPIRRKKKIIHAIQDVQLQQEMQEKHPRQIPPERDEVIWG